jgi:hypothetical protein
METQNDSQELIDFVVDLLTLKTNDPTIPKKTKDPTQPKKRGRPRKAVDENAEPSEPKKIGRPITPWRHLANGKYYSSSKDPNYQMSYWRENYRKPYTCEICGATLQSCGSAVHKHKRTLHCQLAKFKKETQTAN